MQRSISSFLISSLLVVAACSANGQDGELLITKNVALPAGDACTFTGDPSEPSNPQGSVNDQSPLGYLMFPQVESLIQADVTDDPSQMQRKTIIVQSAHISLAFAGAPTPLTLGSDDPTEFDEEVSQEVPPNGGVADLTIIPLTPHLLSTIHAQEGASGSDYVLEAVITVTLNGTMSGEDEHSQPFVYGVEVGNAIDIRDLGACPIPAADVVDGNLCNPLQDGTPTCCDSTDGLVCGSDAPTSS